MLHLKSLIFAAALLTATSSGFAGDPQACKSVRLAEPGWNDLAFTTGVGLSLLKRGARPLT